MKVMTKLFGCVFLTLGIVGCSYPHIDVSVDETLNEPTQLTAQQLQQKIMDKEDFFIVKSLSTCTWCQQLEPVITDFVSSQNIPVFIITVYSIEEEGHPITSFADYNLILELLPNAAYPTLYVIDDGDIVNSGSVGGYDLDRFTTTILRYLD